MSAAPVLCIEHLEVDNRLTVQHLQFYPGQLVHVVGSNGAGKSTLLSCAAGLYAEHRAHVMLRNKPLSEWPLNLLAQERCLLEQGVTCQFEISVREVLNFYGVTTDIPEQLAVALELKSLLNRPITQLSGGELQRVHIARCLLQIWTCISRGEALIFLDEPMQGLDVKYQLAVMDFLTALVAQGNCVIMSCHDLQLTARYATDCVMLEGGRVTASGIKSAVLTAANLSRCFGCEFNLIYSENAYEFYLPRLIP
ncbi:ATP-binding cassette domain-containing protein [Alteromonas sp. ASW11-36]|uniref:ATP-binding cassette domain-containing protein n=1 Tax=Alteromonas arenosi TaxID=3055817 RepID=A0ABT7SUR2_9ALTE|nr:ATP-binding cassette domain-containing protein [Alteromonas sp. ASW11-36]MDM7859910.1 ATP-binding cassette domain-containing protein [Alteromonas sp. ASW11-36]